MFDARVWLFCKYGLHHLCRLCLFGSRIGFGVLGVRVLCIGMKLFGCSVSLGIFSRGLTDCFLRIVRLVLVLRSGCRGRSNIGLLGRWIGFQRLYCWSFCRCGLGFGSIYLDHGILFGLFGLLLSLLDIALLCCSMVG